MILVYLAVALTGAIVCAGSQGESAPVAELLERYGRGESVDEALIASLRTNAGSRDLRRGLERHAGTSSPPLVAAFALHAASLGFEHAPIQVDGFGTSNAFELLELGCATLRKVSGRPTDFELRWQLVAADLITSSTYRKHGSAETFRIAPSNYLLSEHTSHLRGRAGFDAALALRSARFAQAQFYIWRLTWGVAVMRARPELVQREPNRGFALRPLELVLKELAPLRGHPEFSDEARVRSGDALLHLGRTDEALALLAQPVKDPRLEYVRRLLRARHFAQRGNTADAAKEYQAAIVIDPHGRAANLALAGLAYLDAQPDVVARLVASSQTDAQDPWLAYVYPGGADLKARLVALQAEVRGAR